MTCPVLPSYRRTVLPSAVLTTSSEEPEQATAKLDRVTRATTAATERAKRGRIMKLLPVEDDWFSSRLHLSGAPCAALGTGRCGNVSSTTTVERHERER